MPVMSISRPRNTNSGTASSTSELMPSSMRDTTMVRGTLVTQIRKASVAVPKAKPIGTPISTPAASSTTKKNSRFQLPIVLSAGAATQSAAATSASAAATISTGLRRRRTTRSTQDSNISAGPHDVRPAQRRRLDIVFVGGVVAGHRQQHGEEQRRHRDRQHLGIFALA